METKELHIEDIDTLKEKILYFADAKFPVIVCLNGNYYPQNESFPSQIAIGVFREFYPSKDIDTFESLSLFVKQSELPVFGGITYDVKNEIETLSSNNSDEIAWPETYFFEPQILCTFEDNRLVIQSHHCEIDHFLRSVKVYEIQCIPDQSPIDLQQKFSRKDYIETVIDIQRQISLGNVYELNFCVEHFATQVSIHPLFTYMGLNQIAPMPYSCYWKLNDKFLICASPERFLKNTDRYIISQPIKGTIRRGQTQEEDEDLKQKLAVSDKEVAENIMIVDLVRNDLSHTAEDGSVVVNELCKISSFPTVHQMVSTVAARLQTEVDSIQAIKTCFPMGSMSGAPKVSAMQLIEKYEKTKRGIFSGTVGYILPNGNFDLNVVIRSIVYHANKKYLSFQVGSAITIDADPEREYEECLVKTAAIRKVLGCDS